MYLNEYEATLREILQEVRPSLKGLVLMTPYYMETHAGDDLMQKDASIPTFIVALEASLHFVWD